MGSIFLLSSQLFAQASPSQDLDNEIIRLRKELSQVQLEMQRTRSDIDKEKKEFESYKVKAAARMKAQSASIDSLDKDIARVARKNDSLSAQISSVNAAIRQTELGQEGMRQVLIDLCAKVEKAAAVFTPMASQPIVGSVALLKSDLSAKSVDNAEACTRLVQILSQMEEVTGSIQAAQVASPLPDIPGVAYRLRIGTFFEAIANEKATRAAVYRGMGADGKPVWVTSDDPVFAKTIINAINIREGKSLPAFVKLPLVADSSKGGAL